MEWIPRLPPWSVIKQQLAGSMEALQEQYVSLDTVITTEDEDATLCAAPWRLFIQGLIPSTFKWRPGETGRRSAHQKPLP